MYKQTVLQLTETFDMAREYIYTNPRGWILSIPKLSISFSVLSITQQKYFNLLRNVF